MMRPKHKSKDPDYLTNSLLTGPLTMEDKDQFVNLPLINSLRELKKVDALYMNNTLINPNKNDEKSEEDFLKNKTTTLEPPSFYEKDIQRWQNKFNNHIK